MITPILQIRTMKNKSLTSSLNILLLLRGVGVTSLVVQWLRCYLLTQETWVQSPVRKLRSHVPWGS